MTQVPPPVHYQTGSPQQSQGVAIASLICGLVSILTFCMWFLSVPLGIIAVVLGVLARGKAARGEAGGAGLAKAGLICGSIGIVLSLLLTIAAWAGLSMLGSWAEREQQRIQQQQQRSAEPAEPAETPDAPDEPEPTEPADQKSNTGKSP